MFKVYDMEVLSDVAERISQEIRDEYVIGYTPTDRKTGRDVA